MYSKLSTMYYETSKPIGTSLGGDLEFYFEAIKQSRSILEVGSGTGRLLIPFLKEGLKIEGIDASSDMVSMCITHCIEHDVEANVKQIDVYNMSEVGTFDAIIIPTGTFCLFSDPNAVIEGCYEHLEKGGKLVLDLIFPHGFVPGSVHRHVVYPNQKDVLFHEDHQHTINWQTQQTRQFFRYELWRENKLCEQELEIFDLYWYQIDQMETMLRNSGYGQIEWYGDYTKGYDAGSDYEVLTLCAYK